MKWDKSIVPVGKLGLVSEVTFTNVCDILGKVLSSGVDGMLVHIFYWGKGKVHCQPDAMLLNMGDAGCKSVLCII